MCDNCQLNGFFSTIATFGFLYVLIYSIKNDVNTAVMSLVLVALLYVAIFYCPLIRHFVGEKPMKKSKGNK